MFKLGLLVLQGWENLQLIPQLDAALAELSLGIAQLGLILLGSDARINQEGAVRNLIFNFV